MVNCVDMGRPDHSSRGPTRRPKPHWIRPADVAEFLEGSVLTAPVFHCTSLEGREEIVERGVDLGRTRTAVFGRGFYLSSQPIERYGPGVVRAAVRLQDPLV